MSDSNMYTPGTWVWVKLVKVVPVIWWPGKIIDLSSVSKQMFENHYKKTNKIVKIAVCFPTENYT